MQTSDLPTVIATWIRHAQERRKEDFWAWDWVKARVLWDGSAEEAWTITTELVRAAPDELLGFIGAGPVEDLVNRFGGELIDWIEGEARRDPRFQDALGAIWLQIGTLPPEIEARIVAASGGRIEPFEIATDQEAAFERDVDRLTKPQADA